MRVIVCGDRGWTNEGAIYACVNEALKAYDPWHVVVITGGCAGADLIAHEFAKGLLCQTAIFHANWRRGSQAGPQRNRAMLEVCKPDLVIAFHNDLAKSKGTKGMVELALSHGVKVELWTEEGQVDVLEALGVQGGERSDFLD